MLNTENCRDKVTKVQTSICQRKMLKHFRLTTALQRNATDKYVLNSILINIRLFLIPYRVVLKHSGSPRLDLQQEIRNLCILHDLVGCAQK